MELSTPVILKETIIEVKISCKTKRKFTPNYSSSEKILVKRSIKCSEFTDCEQFPAESERLSDNYYYDNLQINNIELFLKKNKESDISSKTLSTTDLNYGKKKYEEIKELNGPCYIIFGYQAHGFIFYILYKSKTNKIYVIKSTLKAIHSYVEIKNESFFNI